MSISLSLSLSLCSLCSLCSCVKRRRRRRTIYHCWRLYLIIFRFATKLAITLTSCTDLIYYCLSLWQFISLSLSILAHLHAPICCSECFWDSLQQHHSNCATIWTSSGHWRQSVLFGILTLGAHLPLPWLSCAQDREGKTWTGRHFVSS